LKHLLIFISILLFLFSCETKKKEPIQTPKEIIPEPVFEFGYNVDNYVVIKDTIRKNDTFGAILDKYHVAYPMINKIVESVKDSFNVKRMRVGKPYTILAKKDSTQKAQVFIYQPNQVAYSVIDFKDSLITTHKARKKTTTHIKTASGIIKSSLFQTLDDQGLNPVLALSLSDIYAWTIDFYRIYKDDKFKVIYEQEYLEDSIPIGIGKIHAAYFEHNKTSFYAFNYMADSILQIPDYFDEESRNLRKAFLKSPIKFGRISSRYSMTRYVSIYGRIKPHLGTDFAAPIGTPIMSTANGVVIKSEYRGGNGNYVKVKHNSTYSTQYLHMKNRAVKVGDVVKQGQVIGYIGMTGSTTGPHVCYRFWKNGQQIDALKEKLPAAKPMNDSIKPHYFEFIKPLKAQLDSIKYTQPIEKVIKNDSLNTVAVDL